MQYLRYLILLLPLLCSSPLRAAPQPTKLSEPQHPHQRVELKAELSPAHAGPGQIIELKITLNTADGVEVSYDPGQQKWGDLIPLGMTQTDPSWHAPNWQQKYSFKLIAQKPGQVELPAVIFNFADQQTSWQQGTQTHALQIIDHFNQQEPTAQPLQEFHWPEQSQGSSEMFALMALLASLVLLFYITRTKETETNATKQEYTAEQALEQISQAENSRNSWTALREWIQQHLQFDPLSAAVNESSALLSRRFQAEFFKPHRSDQVLAELIALCHQQLEGDHREL